MANHAENEKSKAHLCIGWLRRLGPSLWADRNKAPGRLFLFLTIAFPIFFIVMAFFATIADMV